MSVRWSARLYGVRIRSRLGSNVEILLTSNGITNTTIHDALVDLLGKPIAESSALYIPTGVQPFPGGPSHVYGFLTGTVGGPMCALGWKSLGVLELTALPSIKRQHGSRLSRKSMRCWSGEEPVVSVLLDEAIRARRPLAVAAARGRVRGYERRSDGGDSRLGGETYDDSEPLTGSDEALGLVELSVFPHLEREDMPDTSLANIERWAVRLSVPAYAIDDQTAIRVVDGNVEVVSEGHWKLFTPSPEAS